MKQFKIKMQPILTILAILGTVILIANFMHFYPLPADATNNTDNSEKRYQKQLQEITLEQVKKALKNSKSQDEIHRLLKGPFFAENQISKFISLFQDQELDNFMVKKTILSLLAEKLTNENFQVQLKKFFWEVAKDQDLALAQEALIILIQNHEPEALSFLVQHLEKNQLACYPDGNYVDIPWEIIQNIYQYFPQSSITKGLKAYEKISGQDLLAEDQPEKLFSQEKYQPKREIPRWEKWLEKYPGHIATGSVAYRLGRSYEILDQYALALNWYHTAYCWPSDTVKFHAYGRLLYLMDVKMSLERIEAVLNNPTLKPELRPLLEYTLALKLVRSGQYQAGLEKFQDFVKRYEQTPIYALGVGDKLQEHPFQRKGWNFWTKVKGQQAQLTTLSAYSKQISEIQPEESAPLRYEIAALIYRQPYIFYNHFWLGQRTLYNNVSLINQNLNQAPVKKEMESFIKEYNNYYHALQIFQELKKINLSPDLAEKVDFSIALCYAHLEGYGKEIDALWSEREQKQLALEAFQNYLKNYPQGNFRHKALEAVKAYQNSLNQENID